MKRLALAVNALGGRYVGEIDDRVPTPKTLYHAGRSYEVLMTAAVEHRDFVARWTAPNGVTSPMASHVRQT